MKRTLSALILITALAAKVGGVEWQAEDGAPEGRDQTSRLAAVLRTGSSGSTTSDVPALSPLSESRVMESGNAGALEVTEPPIKPRNGRSPMTVIVVSAVAGMICRFIKR